MAFCTNCGAKISDDTKFCPGCGQKIEPKKQVTVPLRETPAQPVEQAAPAESPVQGTYTASYTAPKQQTYQPRSGQQKHSAQNTYSQSGYAAAPKQKKPMNKKALFIIGGAVLAIILAIVLISSLGGKAGNVTDDPNLGIYTAFTAEAMGIEMDIADMFEEGVTIELKANGKCTMNINGTKGNGKWELEDSEFHIEGGGFNCDGTLSNGSMTLENVLDMGIDMTLKKEGGFFSENATAESDAASGLQMQWNGTWYGCLYAREATGDFSSISTGSDGYYDTYMVVDVDGDGKGQFAVYLANVDEAFATANCEARESGLYAIDGTVAGEVDMNAYNWMFLPMRDYPDQYTMGDVIKDGDSVFDFTLFMKQWGGSWQAEIDSDFAIVPPSIESYNNAIENGELPPIGFAPIGYEGTAASGNTDAEGVEPEETPEDEPQEQSTDDYGKSVADADGIVPLDVLIAAGKYCSENRKKVSYEDVYDQMGGVHGKPLTDSVIWRETDNHQYQWEAPTGEYICIGFSVADNGDEHWYNMSFSSGLFE